MRRAAGLAGGGRAAAGIAVPSDKRFRRPDVRPSRRRRIGVRLVRTSRWLVVAAAVAAAGVWLARLVVRSPLFTVAHIVVRGNERLSSAEVDTLLEGMRGQSILLVDFTRYRERLLGSPWVADVTLWRVLPSTVEVRMVERVPAALARLGREVYLIDRDGVVIDEYGPEYGAYDLPIVDGLLAASSGAATADPARTALTMRLLDGLADDPALARRVSQIDASDPHDAAVLLAGDGAWLHVGEDQFVGRLRLYLEIAPALREQLKDIDYVDLRFDHRIFAKPRGRAATLVAGRQ